MTAMVRYAVPTSQGVVTRTSARRYAAVAVYAADAAGWQPRPSFHLSVEAAAKGTWRSVAVAQVIEITADMVTAKAPARRRRTTE